MYNQLLGQKIKQIDATIIVILSTKNTTHACWLARKLNSIPGLPMGCTEMIALEAKIVSCSLILNAQCCKCNEMGIRKQQVIRKITILLSIHFQLNASCINNLIHNKIPTSSCCCKYKCRLTNQLELNFVTCFHLFMFFNFHKILLVLVIFPYLENPFFLIN